MNEPRYTKDSTDKALELLMRAGSSSEQPMLVIGRDGTILFANEAFLAIIRRLGRGYLVRHVDQIRDLIPDLSIIGKVWSAGEPRSIPMILCRHGGGDAVTCECIPFIDDQWERVALVVLTFFPASMKNNILHPHGPIARTRCRIHHLIRSIRSCLHFPKILLP